ncbi:MAG: 16S rRNA (guanine(527)-N(7))-methyltransferase RsmG [Acetobacteraceae bacterium]|nr:16S rRNA (guanine(527)-N(7))-methyltransferase RsmG [Acetobacteraceae bacterium]MCX7685401.1 16S rRNA (guanine(527)-N(7))-methyltransferase RsmG [Acetobacteraceae bacterium]MDW8398932.1 16S rRNA (guanine(527)-N(7))-methyltransferase RsmG [Acetobacteraceae bacterium]
MKHGPERHPIPPAEVSRETAERLAAFAALLLEWNRRINLVSARDAAALRARHIEDSLQLLPLLPPGTLLDIGSGGGFPGLVLAAAEPGRPVHLVESDRRKAAFLATAAARLGLPHVSVHASRAEEAPIAGAAALTARAFAPLGRILPLAARCLAPGGLAILPKGRTAEAELAAALADGWTLRVERFISRTDPHSTIFRIARPDRAGT